MSEIVVDTVPDRAYDIPMKQRTPRYNGNRLAVLLDAQGRRQDWLAERSGISRSLLSRLITGSRTVDKATAERIANALQVPLFLAFDIPTGNDLLPEEAFSLSKEASAA